MKKKKGQAVFEFVIASVVFFSIIFYVLNFMYTVIATYNSEFNIAALESKSIQIGELLVKEKGLWTGQTPSIVGLALDWPVLNETNINSLDIYCDDDEYYVNLIDNFNLGRRKFNINVSGENIPIFNGDGKDGFDCGPPIPNLPKARTERFAVLNDDIIRVTVWVW